jgi:hypothetical protein
VMSRNAATVPANLSRQHHSPGQFAQCIQHLLPGAALPWCGTQWILGDDELGLLG